MELQEFYDLCKSHDWYYEYTDDHRVWQRGFQQRRTLLDTLNQNQSDPRFSRVYNYFRNKNK